MRFRAFLLMYKKYLIISLFLTALALRIFLVPNHGFEADVAFWKSWGLSALDNGVVVGIGVTNNNYPAPFSYVLGLLAFIYRLFADPHIFDSYWNSGNVLFLLISKLPSILADLGIAGLILWIGNLSKRSPRFAGEAISQIFPPFPPSFYFLLCTLYLFNPIALIDGALWAQVDSLGVFVFLIAVLLAASDKPVLAGAVYVLSMMMKLQNMIYGPLFFLLLWQLGSLKGLVKGAVGAACAFFFLNVEFLLKKNMGTVMESLTSNYDYFPLMSLNAFNLWWIVAKGQGMQVSDKLLAIGMINAKTTGLLLFSSGYVLSGITMVKETMKKMWNKPSLEGTKTGGMHGGPRQATATPRCCNPQSGIDVMGFLCGQQTDEHSIEEKRSEDVGRGSCMTGPVQNFDILYHFFTALIIVALSFFLFQTESHDRYAFPACVFLLLWGLFYVWRTNTEKMRMFWWKTKTFRIFIIGYIVFSILFFLNLHTALAYNYPHNSIPALLFLKSPTFTIPLSVFQIAVFLFFLYIARRTIRLGAFLLASLFLIGSCLALNLPLLTKSPVSLTKLTPFISQQGYGVRTTDMPVNAAGPSKNWNRLSVQYSFYKKGIGTHANSYIVYDVAGLFRRFTADVGIDTEAGAKGSVVFKIYGDDRLLYQSDVVKRFEYPRHADIEITGVKKFALIVEDGGDGINDDHADWLRPTLWP